ncbi:Tryptophan synthase alpha chain [Labilithrix luteola]|uniref:Tryptophan synthase alpha chain n=1 Tax=Labilithrix luteola TaxID=1391654 RepID=A0A0K1QFF4_9BACT|nr:hypothetical protein [Labilithrix luteola]AKV04453.1 Tryptophan synthase alpha chain [Labilithrix luteola]
MATTSQRLHLILALFLSTGAFVVGCSSSDETASGSGGPQSEQVDAGGGGANAPDAPQSPETTGEGCGGLNAPACGNGQKCKVGKDCQSLSCQGGICAAPNATDGIKNGDETDVDCGGSSGKACADNAGCAAPADCVSLVCKGSHCAPPSSTDAVKNGDETDVDCGGSSTNAKRCDDLKACKLATDCTSKVCTGNVCQVPTSTDNVQNGDETDVDCGGSSTNAKRCDDLKACKLPADCASKVCTGDVCQVPTSTDNVQNGDETDVDCGGSSTNAKRCDDLKACKVATDCTSKVCTGDVCQVPTGTDNVQNGDESAVDCGGTKTGAKRCDAGVTCNGHDDCASNGCAYNGVCAVGRSCTRRLGGETCGAGEVGEAGAAHESCCATAKVSATSPVRIDKYHVTAGRMRAFIERTGGNVKSFVGGLGTAWNAAWTPYVPSDATTADAMLGSFWFGAPNDADATPTANQWSKRSCAPGSFGGHTYWTPANGTDFSSFTVDDLDPKALNCVGWHLLKAFCAFEGGRLATSDELIKAFTNVNTTTYPWNWTDIRPWAGPGNQDQYGRLNHKFSYGYPGAAPLNGSGTVRDIAWYVSPPGRFPGGLNKNGVEVAGNLLHWTNNAEYQFLWTISWEQHGNTSPSTQDWKSAWPGEPNGYYALGGRCAYDK